MRKRGLFKTMGITFLVLVCLGLFYFAAYSSLGGGKGSATPQKHPENLPVNFTNTQNDSLVGEFASSAILFCEVLARIQVYYIDDIKDLKRRLVYPAIKSMVSSLDPYSHFFTPEEAEIIRNPPENNGYKGFGIEFGYDLNAVKKLIEKRNGAVTINDVNSLPVSVKKVYWDSPAEKEGVGVGDAIIKINGVPIEEIGAPEIEATADPFEKFQKRTQAILKMVTDEKNEIVEISVKRNDEIKDFCIQKGIVDIVNVYWDLFGPEEKPFGYLKIESFLPIDTGIMVDEAMADFKAAKAAGVILDLRGNTGGDLSNAQSLLGNFFKPDTLVATMKSRSDKKKLLTDKRASDWNIPIVVLIDSTTVSASEIVTGVLRDYKRAILLGEKTYGKGVGQAVFKKFSDGSVLWLTNFKYYLPSGECIHGKGIDPDIVMSPVNDEAILKEAEEILNHWDYYKKLYLK